MPQVGPRTRAGSFFTEGIRRGGTVQRRELPPNIDPTVDYKIPQAFKKRAPVGGGTVSGDILARREWAARHPEAAGAGGSGAPDLSFSGMSRGADSRARLRGGLDVGGTEQPIMSDSMRRLLVRELQTERSRSKREQIILQLEESGYDELGEPIPGADAQLSLEAQLAENVRQFREEQLGLQHGDVEQGLEELRSQQSGQEGRQQEDVERGLSEIQEQHELAMADLIKMRDAGLMGEEEFQGELAANKENVEAGFDRLAREFGEQAIGRLPMGVIQGMRKDFESARIGELAGGERQIRAGRAARKTEAFSRFGTAAAGLSERTGLARAQLTQRPDIASRFAPQIAELIQRKERPFPEPPEGLSPRDLARFYGGGGMQPVSVGGGTTSGAPPGQVLPISRTPGPQPITPGGRLSLPAPGVRPAKKQQLRLPGTPLVSGPTGISAGRRRR